MKLLKNASYLLFITLFLTSCDETDSQDSDLVGQWSWLTTVTTITESNGNMQTFTEIADVNNTWSVTLNDDNTFTEIRFQVDDYYPEGETEVGGGTWSINEGVLTIVIIDGDESDSFDLDYILSNESNTLTMTQLIENEDSDQTVVAVFVFDRVE